MAITKIPAAGFTGNNFRNIIINGDMSIAQRSTSSASITSGGYYTIDRWRLGLATAGTWTMSQSTDVPSGYGFAKSLKLDCTTANASPASNAIFLLSQRFEGQNLQFLKKGTANALSLTLSFWVKSTKTGTFIAELEDTDNTRTVSKSYTVNTTDTWEFKTITFPPDTTGVLDNDNADSLKLNFWLVAGTDLTSGTLQTTWGSLLSANRAVGQVNIADDTSNDWYITGVQLEAGTTASDFEFLPVDVNLGRCLRYYELFTGANAHAGLYAGSTYIGHIQYKARKRTRPTLTIPAGKSNVVSSINNSSSGDKGGTDNLFFEASANGYVIEVTIDAEL